MYKLYANKDTFLHFDVMVYKPFNGIETRDFTLATNVSGKTKQPNSTLKPHEQNLVLTLFDWHIAFIDVFESATNRCKHLSMTRRYYFQTLLVVHCGQIVVQYFFSMGSRKA